MNTRLFTASLGITLMVTLTACGGGGGEETAIAPAAPQAPEATEAPVLETPVISTTSDLKVSDQFTFQADAPLLALTINVDTKYGYVTLCSLLSDNSINLSNCILRAPLSDGKLVQQVAITSGTQSLGAVLWDYNALDDRPEFIWSISDGLNFIIN